MKFVLLFCVVATALLGTVHSQATCTLPTVPEITTLIIKLLNSGGGEGGNSISAEVLSHHFTCIAVSSTEDTIRLVSVAVVFNRNVSGTVDTLRQQFQFQCSSNVLTVADSQPVEMSPPLEAFNATTRRDCFTCAVSGSTTIDEITNCAVCASCQNQGQGFCTGSSACCPFYQDGTCTTSCTGNRNASAATNFTCVCSDGFVENGNGMCVDVCDPNPCQNNGTCSSVGSTVSCSCLPGFTGDNCETEVVPSSTPTPSATPTTTTPTTSRPCPDNCQQCNSQGCCMQCEPNFGFSGDSSCPRSCVPTPCPDGCNTCFNSTCCRECQPDYQLVISGSTCTCNAKPTEPAPVCFVPNCTTCNLVDGRPCCAECQEDFTTNECRCLVITVSDPSAVAAGIAIGVVLFVLLLLALAILAAYLIYAFVTHGTDSKRTKSHMPFGNGDAHDNPLYINPKELDDDEP